MKNNLQGFIPTNLNDNEKLKIEQQIKSELVKKGTMRPHPNHKLWGYSPDGVVYELGDDDLITREIQFEKELRKVVKIKTKKDHLYVAALRKESAEKKFKNLLKKLKKWNQETDLSTPS